MRAKQKLMSLTPFDCYFTLRQWDTRTKDTISNSLISTYTHTHVGMFCVDKVETFYKRVAVVDERKQDKSNLADCRVSKCVCVSGGMQFAVLFPLSHAICMR